MAKNISGMIDTQGKPAEGARFHSSIVNKSPYAVVVTYKEPFDRVPIAVTSMSGTTAGVTCALQSSNTSLAIYTDSEVPVPLFFWASTRGLS